MKNKLPLLPIRDLVIFPQMVMSLLVGREKSIGALEKSMDDDKLLFVCTQKSHRVEEPGAEDLYAVGVIAEVLQSLKLPDGSFKVVIKATERGVVKKIQAADGFDKVNFKPVREKMRPSIETEARMRSVASQFDEYAKLNTKIPPETLVTVNSITSAAELSDVIAGQLSIKIPEKQRLLEEFNPLKRLDMLAKILNSEIEIMRVEKKILGDVKKQLDKSQKDYYLQEQLKAIEKELGLRQEDKREMQQLRRQIKKAGMQKEATEAALRELSRLERMNPVSPESAVVRNYIDWLLRLPWKKHTKDHLDIKKAKKVLDEDHYGLSDPKTRILEYLAVRKFTRKAKGQILCFVGPPGVGKTSLAKSIARALGRNFIRVSLGGVRDEAEIKGHRRTYVGALPGRIMQSVAKAKSKNPVFLLDEVDKMSADYKGDPSSALLEVLDPEENHSFSDHYLEVDFDLSNVMFITTSNIQDNIPHPLLDRMEVIKLPGYTEDEKFHIAKNFLIPKQLNQHGLNHKHLFISDNALSKIIKQYTLEAGVRNLERNIANICRKTVKGVVETKSRRKTSRITATNLHKYLGPPKYTHSRKDKHHQVGVAYGLAWTQTGGSTMPIETAIVKGTGKLILTGKLGDVMQESARAALTYIRSRVDKLKINANFYKTRDIHIHVPEGAIPKDGPSAGITIATSIASAITRIPADKNVAMTGEITLRGQVLAVGGLKSKILAAHRAGFKKIIIPKENKKDLIEIPKDVLRKIHIRAVESIDEVIPIALLKEQKRAKGKKKSENEIWPGAYIHSQTILA